MSDPVKVLIEPTSVAPLGLRFWDPVSQRSIGTGFGLSISDFKALAATAKPRLSVRADLSVITPSPSFTSNRISASDIQTPYSCPNPSPPRCARYPAPLNSVHQPKLRCHPERSEGSILLRIDPSLRSG